MLWRKASRKWQAKGHTLTSVADKIEARFGKSRKLGRSTVGVLVTTKQEEVPPDVLEFLEALPVLDEETWAEYLLHEPANAPPPAPGPTPVAAPEPRDKP